MKLNIRITTILLLALFCRTVVASNLPDGFSEKLIAGNLDPTVLAECPDGRIFIAEKDGRILILDKDTLLHEPFLELEVDNFNERGLTGLVFHPDFEMNGYFYVYYGVPRQNMNRLSRFRANGNYGIPSSEEVLFETENTGYIHSAGALVFGTDKKLYVSIGDLNKGVEAQSLSSSSGKILRLNMDGSIPEDNPFYDVAEGKYRAIWSLGLRNSFSMTQDYKSGRIFAGDVGLEDWEEINEIVRGANYGWNFGEGKLTLNDLPDGYKDPIYAYENDGSSGCAITGVASYSTTKLVFPAKYHGVLFYSDYCAGEIRTIDPNTGRNLGVFASGINYPLNLIFTQDGEMYYIERNAAGSGEIIDNTLTRFGRIWKVSYTNSKVPTISVQPQDVRLVPGDDAAFKVSVFGKDLQYSWYQDSQKIQGAFADTLLVESVQLADHGKTYFCRVSNEFGELQTRSALLSVFANTRPASTIVLPAAGQRYQAGDTLHFEGFALDQEDGQLASDRLSWTINFHHDQHSHPFVSEPIRADKGYVVIPSVGETSPNVWYNVILTSTDAHGFISVATRKVFPEFAEININSVPDGLLVNLDGAYHTTPINVESVRGILHTVSAPSYQMKDDEIYFIDGWNEDGESSITFDFYADEDPTNIEARFIGGKIGTGRGLLGTYYDDPAKDFSGPMVLERLDTNISFRWLDKAPAAEVPEDQFSVRWSGFIEAPLSGDYTLYINADDGFRLWMDGEVILDDWRPGQERENSISLTLEQGKKYPIVLDFFEAFGYSVCELSWSSEYFPRQGVLPSQLYPKKIDPEDIETRVLIRPNPVSDGVVAIQVDGVEVLDAIQIYSLAGQMVYNKRGMDTDNVVYVDMTGYPSGVYVLKTRFGETTMMQNFVKL